MATRDVLNNTLAGQTGTGAYAGDNTPTLTTPIIGTIKDANSNTILLLNPTASAVNYMQFNNSATAGGGNGGNIALTISGADTNVTLQLAGKGTSGVVVQGRSNGNSVATGYVGEVVSANVLSSAPVSLSNNTGANVTSISLTAGDWDVHGNVGFLVGGTCTAINAQVTTTSATLGDYSLHARIAPSTSQNNALTCPILRVNVSTTTTVYLVAYASFTTSTVTACGSIYARRSS